MNTLLTNTNCNLCSKISPPRLVRITKCAHTFCTICILTYLKKRKFCPVCVPYNKRKKFHFLTYLHPIKLLKKIKKHRKKISPKHLKPLFVETARSNQPGVVVHVDAKLISRVKFNPITVEKDVFQTKANESDMNNNVNINSDYSGLGRLSDVFDNQDKHAKIKKLIVKNENLRLFIEKIHNLQDTMSNIPKLKELNKLIDELTENQSELTNESNVFREQVQELREIDTRLERLIAVKTRQKSLLDQTESINHKFSRLIDELKEQNSELRESYEKLLDGIQHNLNIHN